METKDKTTITVQTTVNAPIEKTWDYWTTPKHIMQWNNASDDWYSPIAVNDLRVGGKFNFRMEAKDGSMGFDFEGTYNEVKVKERIAYKIIDGREVHITFTAKGNATEVTETFVPEEENTLELQRGGWQAILDNFKKYTEAN
ncbi:MAG: SRPBCC family protein [Chitinophagaceae bacterium]|nr:SRPBCC family protein [Chitinophagaceae bacterium]